MIAAARFVMLGGAALLAACATVPPPVQSPPADNVCPVVDSSDWTAWVNAMPGPNAQPMLVVTELEALPPDQMATQALDTHELRGEWPITPPVGSVTITCDGRTLARIAPVETAR